MQISVGETLKDILQRIQPKIAEPWPCRHCGAVQPAGSLAVQEDLCGKCLTQRRQSVASEKIQSQVGPKYADCNFKNFRQTPSTAKVVTILQQYAENPKAGVFIHGPSGVGKTHLATSLMRAFIERGQDCYYTTMTEMLVRLKRSMDQPQSQDEMQFYCQAPVLILDDLGVGPATDWVRQMTHLLLDRRDRFLKPIIVVSNLPLDRVSLLLGDPVASRISGMCKILKVGGKDSRLEGPAAVRSR